MSSLLSYLVEKAKRWAPHRVKGRRLRQCMIQEGQCRGAGGWTHGSASGYMISSNRYARRIGLRLAGQGESYRANSPAIARSSFRGAHSLRTHLVLATSAVVLSGIMEPSSQVWEELCFQKITVAGDDNLVILDLPSLDEESVGVHSYEMLPLLHSPAVYEPRLCAITCQLAHIRS